MAISEFGPLIGALVGGTISLVTTMYVQKLQAASTLRAERRAQEQAATAKAMDASAALIQSLRAPDDDIESRHRLALAVASQDIRSSDVRARLGEAHKIMTLAGGVQQMIGREVSNTIWFAANHTLEVVGAYRRGEPVPAEPNGWAEALAATDEWIDINSQ